MYCIIRGSEIHSAWNTLEEADYQKHVLHKSGGAGYLNIVIQFCDGMTCDNGQYFV